MNLNAVTINSGTTMTAPATTLGIAGTFTSTGTFNNGGGTILFNGTSNLTAVEVYNNITVSGSVTSAGNFSQTINGNLVNNGSFSIGTGVLTWGGSGTLSGTGNTIASDLNITGSSCTYTSSGNFTLSDDLLGTGSFDASGGLGTIIFSGAGSAINAGTRLFRNLSVTGTLTPSGYSIDGDLNVTGTLNAGTGTTTFGNAGSSTASAISGAGAINFLNIAISSGHTLTSSPNTINVTGNFTNNGSFAHNSGTVQFSTAGTKTISGNGTTFNNLTVGNGTGNTTVTNSLTPLNLRGRLNINSAIANTFNTGGSSNFILLSSGDNPTVDGSIGPIPSPAVLNGGLTAQRSVSSEGRVYRYIASPVVGATVADWQDDLFVTGTFTGAHNGSTPGCTGCTTNPSSFFYNESTPGFVAYPTPATGSNADPVINGRGYSVYFRHDLQGGMIIDYPGNHPPTAGVSVPVAPNIGGFSLAGNPYPSPVLWSTTGVTRSGISDVISIRDNPGGGVFRTLDITAGTGIIAIGQAFWVETTGASPSLTFSEAAKTASQGNFYREDLPLKDEVTIFLKKTTNNITDGIVDEATIRIKPGGTLAYDPALDGGNSGNNAIATKSSSEADATVQVHDLSVVSTDAKNLAVQSVESFGCSQSFPLHLKDLKNPAYASLGIAAESTVTYTFSINPTGALKGLTWSLHDSETGTSTNLSDGGEYVFTTSTDVLASRFSLVVSSTPINTATQITASSVNCSGSDAFVTIANSQPGMTYAAEINGVLQPFYDQGNGNAISLKLTPDQLSASNTVRIKVNSGCEQQFLSTTLNIDKAELIVAQASGASLCSPGSAALTASGGAPGTTYKWFVSATASEPVFTGADFTTPVLAESTSYFVAALNQAGCEGPRVEVPVTIGNNGADLSVSASADQVCPGQTVTLTATGAPQGGSYKWFETATATTALSTDAQFITAALYKPTKYFVASVDAGGCESNRMEVTADVSKFYPVISTILTEPVICKTGVQRITASDDVNSSQFRWYESETATSVLAEGVEFTTPILTASKTYYVSALSGTGCESGRVPVLVEVNTGDATAGLGLTVQSTCQSGESVIKVNNADPIKQYNWYSSATASTKLEATPEFITPTLNATTSFFVAVADAFGCEGSKKEVVVQPQSVAVAVIEVEGNRLKSNAAEGIQWFFNGELLPGEVQQTLTPQVTGLYSLRLRTAQGCESFAEREFTVTGLEDDLARSIQVYPNPTSDEFNIAYSGVGEVAGALLDGQGRAVQQFSVESQATTVDVRALQPGFYIFRFKSDKNVSFKKVIIR
jgi:hypothetical protein